MLRKPEIADPEGATTARALRDLGYDVVEVRFGREILVELPPGDADEAEAAVHEMCERLLANPIIEDYDVERL
ncbi:MAG TPA: phosphoribosylformylglycinamidine synthase, purS protein [Actinobacteria bacterium]|nr:phosphoribosylformylglycinamidine synthase, purS protein [Actinomycetota bacterium]